MDAMQAYNKTSTPEAEKDLWQTPPEVLKAVMDKFGIVEFDVDLCASEHNKVAHVYCDNLAEIDEVNYYARAWMNPPFSEKDKLCRLAVDYVSTGLVEQLFLLIPDKPETKLFRDLERRASYVIRFNKRIDFVKPDGGRTGAVPFASVVFVFMRGSLEGMCQQVRIDL